jgi:hypothetical protein
MKMKVLFLSLLAVSNVYATQTATTKATANYASGMANINMQATGNVTYSITNNSSSTQSYTIDRYMCIKNANCTHYHDVITVGAHLTNSGGGFIATYATLPKGTYQDEATIQISGYEQSYAQGVNTVSVN